MKTSKLILLFAVSLSMLSCNDEYPDLEDGLYAEFKTSKGPFIAELYFEETPLTVSNFVALAEGTHPLADSTYNEKKYYDGLIFHRVIDGFMIQGGDPTGTGSGGPGYKYPDEFVDSLSHDSKGLLSMANAGPATNGSQFFITLTPVTNLDGKHSVFGKIVKGQKVVDSIGKVKTGPRDKPVEDVVMNEVNIIRKGKAAKDFEAAKTFQNQLQDIKTKEAEKAEKLVEMRQQKAANFSKLKEKAETLDSGLQIYFETKGEGEKPTVGQKVTVDYEGYFADGTLFDTSKKELAKETGIYDHRRESSMGYTPMGMTYGPEGRAIAGFKEGIQQMKIGDQAILFIPSHLAYGEQGAGGGLIPPNTDLVFRVKLVEIIK